MDNSSNQSVYNMEDDLQRKATVAMMNALDAILAQLKRIEDKQNSLQAQLHDIKFKFIELSEKVDVITPDIFRY